jgi:hypothetical protein
MSARNAQKKPEIRGRQAAKTAAIGSHGAVTRRADRSSYRLALLAGASTVALLAATLNASARPLGSSAPSPSAAAIAAAQSGSQEAARAALQAQESMRRATLAVQAMQARQAAAREAEKAAHGSISNGLRPGGLQVAPGVVQGSNLWQGADLPTEFTNGGRTEVTVKQNQQKAILTWQTFNVGKIRPFTSTSAQGREPTAAMDGWR